MPSVRHRAVLAKAVLAGTVSMLLSLALSGAPAGALGDPGEARVLRTTVEGPITPVIDDHLADAVARAEDGGYVALVVEIDTPGGLDSSMRDIVQGFLAAEVPIVAYVSPPGARAGSAGALIALSANVVAMAPGTAIGASTPVSLDGAEVGDKVVNDAAAFAEAIAERRGRNVEVAVDMVREGRSLPVGEAVEVGAVDLEAGSLTELLGEIDGVEVDVGIDERSVTLRTAGARVDDEDMGLFRRIQQTLADPNLAFLFLSIGTLAIIYELASPGVGAGGVVGAISLLLALFSLSVLPVNAAGLLLLLVAVVMFVAELFAPGVGIAAAGGTVALVLAGVFLFPATPGLELSMAVVLPIAVVIGAAVVVAGRLVVRSRRAPVSASGHGVLIGQVAIVRRRDGAPAQAFVEGAWWTVRTTAPSPPRGGSTVRVVGLEGLDLIVEPDEPDEPVPPGLPADATDPTDQHQQRMDQ
ncbi:MAG: NfeD family protein [Acidimicrobiales bacterium]